MRSRFLALMIAFLLVGPSLSPFAPLTSAEAPDLPVTIAQLAAMTPDGDDFPASFELRQEIAVSPEEVALRTDSASTARRYDRMGYLLSYVSSYYDTASLTEVTITIDVYRDSDAAVSGFEYFIGDEANEDGAAPLDGIGGSPRALRAETSNFADGINSSDAQAAFTYGPLVANVYANSFGPSGIRQDLVVSLAASLSDRIEAVMDGEPAPQADLNLSGQVVQGSQAATYQEGFLSYADMIPAGMRISKADFAGAYFRAYDFPFPSQQGELTIPVEGPLRADGVLFVTVATASFTTPEAAQTAHYQSGSLMLPTVLPQGTDSFRMQGEQPALVNLDETARSEILESSAYQVAILPGGPLDSVRFTVLIGNQIGIVEVAGAASMPVARQAAELILEDQVECIARGACEPSAAIDQAPEIALETAEPVSTADDWPADLDKERLVFDTVWRTVRDQYAYRTGRENILLANYKELDWGAVRAQYEPSAIEAALLGDEATFYATIQAMVSTLDDQHAGFRDPEATKVSRTDPEDVVYVGIGATIARSLDPNNPGLILSVYPGSPADQAGLQRGDRILAVNGTQLDANDQETLRLIHHEYVERTAPDDLGGPLELVVRKAGQREPITLSVARTRGPSEMLPVIERLESAPDVGYIQIPEFGSFNLVGQVEAGLQRLLENDMPLRGLILDVRGNPGGYIISFQSILGHFVDGEVGKYYLRDGTAGRPLVIEPAADKAQFDTIPLVVLTDNRMYSAAEMTAQILQAEGRATVVGVPSPGDVEIVTSYRMPDQSSVGVPFGIFVSPGRYVEGIGVQPDVFVGVDWTEFAPDEDPYIATAIDVLHGT